MWRESSCSVVIAEVEEAGVVWPAWVEPAVVDGVWAGTAMGEGESQLRAM
jgi:hypothetical protein